MDAQDALSWLTADGFNATLALMLAVFVLVFVASTINDNYSWVDRTWSIAPVMYTWIIVAFRARESGHWGNSLVSLLGTAPFLFALAITAWGLRLTFNFFRRGGYVRGGEDYRWNYVRTWPVIGHPVVWPFFNLFVISLFQTWLLWAITLPLLSLPVEPATPRDYMFIGIYVALLTLETICDNQQWRFQNAKLRSKEGELKYGFCVTGAFGFSRHLNVFCEGSLWVALATAVYAHPDSAMPAWQWSGCVALVILVNFSTAVITERLTKKKYPLYAVYQATTPMLLPAFTSTTAETLYCLERASSR